MKSSHQTSTLWRYFAGIAEYVFQAKLGVADPPLVDYVSCLLTRFVRSDAMHKVRNPTGQPLTQVTEMLVEANARIGMARRDVHRHIGDFTLFWAGVYPETLRELQAPEKKDHFIDYCSHGKRAYLIASSIETDDAQDAPADILKRLSFDFDLCAYGLREVRREWERRDGEKPQMLLE